MNEKKIKLLSLILAVTMTCAACGIDYEEEYEEGITISKDNHNTPTESITEETTKQEETTIPTTIVVPDETEPIVPPVVEPDPTPGYTYPETERPLPRPTEKEEPIVEPDKEESINAILTPTTTVNVRAGNTTDALRIGNLQIGDSAYRILSCDNGWDLIKCNGIIGYVCNDYLEYKEEAEKDIYEHEFKKDLVLTTTDLNFRTGPNTSYDKIDKLPTNTELQVIAKTNNDWYLVNYNGTLGYVSSNYTTSILEKVKQEYPNIDLNEIDIEKVVYSNATKLNIRNGNSTDYDIIGELTRYETVRVLKEVEDWYFILTNDYNLGFVSKGYTKDLTDKFVVVDLDEQQLWLYNNNQLYLTTPVTTGKDTSPSDIGYFKIYAKQKDRYLTGPGYKSWVAYWMPYNGGEGLHDASWRSVFGTQSYHTNGSHGCINMPPEIAGDVYNNVEVGTKVLVHK